MISGYLYFWKHPYLLFLLLLESFFFCDSNIFNLPAGEQFHKHALYRTLSFFWPPNLNNPADPNWEWNLSKDQVEHFKHVEPTHLKNMLVKLDHLPPNFSGWNNSQKIFLQPAARQFLFWARDMVHIFSPQKIARVFFRTFVSCRFIGPDHENARPRLWGPPLTGGFKQPDPGDDDFCHEVFSW